MTKTEKILTSPKDDCPTCGGSGVYEHAIVTGEKIPVRCFHGNIKYPNGQNKEPTDFVVEGHNFMLTGDNCLLIDGYFAIENIKELSDKLLLFISQQSQNSKVEG